MEVERIPIPAAATIKVSKEGKSAVFETTVIHTTDNKYIYVTPVRRDKKLINFAGKGILKEIRVQFNETNTFTWKNIAIGKFIEEGKLYLRIRTTTPGIHVAVRQDKDNDKGKKKKKQAAQ